MKNLIIAIAALLCLLAGCSINHKVSDGKMQRIAKLPISSKRRQRFAMQLANAPVSELFKNDFDTFYSCSFFYIQDNDPKLDSIQKNETKAVYFNALEQGGYKNMPFPAYTLDFNALSSTLADNYSDKLIVNDTVHAYFINYKKNNDVLCVMYASKRNNNWKVYNTEANTITVNLADSSSNDSSPTMIAIKKAYKYSNNVFIITTTKPSIFPSTRHVIGFTNNGNVNVITFHFGIQKIYHSVKDWLLDDKNVFKQNGIKQIIK